MYYIWNKLATIVNKIKGTTCDKCRWYSINQCGCIGGLYRYADCCRGFWNHSFEPK